jgi:hypothetical protein
MQTAFRVAAKALKPASASPGVFRNLLATKDLQPIDRKNSKPETIWRTRLLLPGPAPCFTRFVKNTITVHRRVADWHFNSSPLPGD